MLEPMKSYRNFSGSWNKLIMHSNIWGYPSLPSKKKTLSPSNPVQTKNVLNLNCSIVCHQKKWMRWCFVTLSTDFHTNTYFSRSGNRWLHLPKEYNLIHIYILLVTPSSQIHLQLSPLGKLKHSLRQQDWGVQERRTCIHKRFLPVLPCAENCCKSCATL